MFNFCCILPTSTGKVPCQSSMYDATEFKVKTEAECVRPNQGRDSVCETKASQGKRFKTEARLRTEEICLKACPVSSLRTTPLQMSP